MLSLTIRAAIELLSSAGWLEVVVGRSKYEAGGAVKGPMRIVNMRGGLSAAYLVLSEWIHLASDAL